MANLQKMKISTIAAFSEQLTRYPQTEKRRRKGRIREPGLSLERRRLPAGATGETLKPGKP
jgi:hypothetical protein